MPPLKPRKNLISDETNGGNRFYEMNDFDHKKGTQIREHTNDWMIKSRDKIDSLMNNG